MKGFVLKKDDKYYINKIVLILSIVVLLISFTQTAFCVNGFCGITIGIFFFGYIGLPLCLAGLFWLANPFLILSWNSYKNIKKSFILSAVSSVLAFSFLFFDEYHCYLSNRHKYIESIGLGYWLWLTSNLIMFIGNGIILSKNKDIDDAFDNKNNENDHVWYNEVDPNPKAFNFINKKNK